jgi:ribosomal protein S8
MRLALAIAIIKFSQKKTFFCCIIPKTVFLLNFLKELQIYGFIYGYRPYKEKIKVFLKYGNSGKGALLSIKLRSRPGKRLFYPIYKIRRLLTLFSYLIISSKTGLKLLSNNILNKDTRGGEVLCTIK